MALYEFDLTVPANTLASAPVSAEHLLTPGLVTRLAVQFPAGCVSMVLAQVLREGSVVWPNNPDSAAKANGFVIESATEIDVSDRPYSLIARAWSPGTTYPHVLTFRYEVRPQALVDADRQSVGLLGKLGRLLGIS